MAVRVVLSKARSLCLQLNKLGFLGAARSSTIVGRNSYFNTHFSSWNYECRRRYYIPPPPSLVFADYPSIASIHCVDDAQTNPSVIESAKFAVKAQNEASSSQDVENTIQYGRVLSARRRCGVLGFKYYITLEAIRGKAEMNVYYAEVVDRRESSKSKSKSKSQMELIKWELVDDSFSYPFQEIRQIVYYRRKFRRETAAAKNQLVSKWLNEMEQQCRDGEATKWISPEDKIDSVYLLSHYFSNGMQNAESCSEMPSGIDHCPRVSCKDIVRFYDIKTYEMVYEYASFAMRAHFKNEDKQVHLESVLWAFKSKVKASWFYRIVLEAFIIGEKESNYYYAIVKVFPNKSLELIKWYLIPGTWVDPDKKEGIVEHIQWRFLSIMR